MILLGNILLIGQSLLSSNLTMTSLRQHEFDGRGHSTSSIESLMINKWSGWWFGTCFFPYIWNNNPNWLIFFRGVGQPPTSDCWTTSCFFYKPNMDIFQHKLCTVSPAIKKGIAHSRFEASVNTSSCNSPNPRSWATMCQRPAWWEHAAWLTCKVTQGVFKICVCFCFFVGKEPIQYCILLYIYIYM